MLYSITYNLFIFSLFRKQIYYNSKEEDDKGKNKKRRQRNNYQKKFPLSKSEVIQDCYF